MVVQRENHRQLAYVTFTRGKFDQIGICVLSPDKYFHLDLVTASRQYSNFADKIAQLQLLAIKGEFFLELSSLAEAGQRGQNQNG